MKKRKKFFVANFHFEVDEDALTELFSKYGEVYDATVARDEEENESLGWGFVEMFDVEVEDIIDRLNGKRWKGMHLRVSEYRPRKKNRSS